MNYLAHIYLSGNNKKIQIGNFIGDMVKGKDYNRYPSDIKKGILLHRYIDHYTDNHTLVKGALIDMKLHFGRYSGILLDMYFDHILASQFENIAGTNLKKYTFHFYLTLIKNYKVLPDRLKGFLWHFILSNRLRKYASLQGLKESLDIMVEYKGVKIDTVEAINYISNNKDQLTELFLVFLKDVENASLEELVKLEN